MDTIVGIITTAAARSATAPVASSPPTTIRQEATARVVVAATTLHPTAAVAALATDRAARVPPLPNRVRSVTAAEAGAALAVTSRQALGRPYRTVRSHPTLPRHPEVPHQAVPIAHHPEAIVHRQGVLPPADHTVHHPGALHQAVRIVRHREAIVHHPGAIRHPAALTAHHQGAIRHPAGLTARHPEAIVRHQDQAAIRGEHKVAAEVLEAVGDYFFSIRA